MFSLQTLLDFHHGTLLGRMASTILLLWGKNDDGELFDLTTAYKGPCHNLIGGQIDNSSVPCKIRCINYSLRMIHHPSCAFGSIRSRSAWKSFELMRIYIPQAPIPGNARRIDRGKACACATSKCQGRGLQSACRLSKILHPPRTS